MNLEYLKNNWNNRPDPEIMARIWDRASSDYAKKPLPDFQTNSFLKLISDTADLNQNMSCLDIGCGSGSYSLALAPYVGSAVGVDLSSSMIETAKRQKDELGLSNVSFSCLDWDALDIRKAGYYRNFDLVFAKMTPAVCNYSTFDKMIQCSRNLCYFQKNTRRHDQVLDTALSLIGLPDWHQQTDEDIVNVFACLWLQGYEPQVFYHQEIWHPEKTLENACAWCIDRAKLQKEVTVGEEQIIRDYLSSIEMNGIVRETITTTIVTMYWKV
ncbi:MAG: class I SAM-dependent methyltransferase [Lachnospiraceae bacterium]|nr:class I SAM-dependent methyltransferase [Lachnospiraceae bacterium]